jgi:hypothetical protein
VESRDLGADKGTAAGFFLTLLMILAFSPLNVEVQAAASSETATSIETTIGVLFPYIWWFLIVMICAVVAYDALKG